MKILGEIQEANISDERWLMIDIGIVPIIPTLDVLRMIRILEHRTPFSTNHVFNHKCGMGNLNDLKKSQKRVCLPTTTELKNTSYGILVFIIGV